MTPASCARISREINKSPKKDAPAMDINTLYKISYGVYIVSSMKGEKRNGLISTTVFQTTAEPPTITASINKRSLTHEYILHSKVFGVSVLSRETPMKFIGTFGFKSGRDIDKFEGVECVTGATGAPIVLDNAVAYLDAKVVNSLDLGTHTLFVGELVGAETLNDNALMTYAYYHDVKHGRSPEAAPTFIGKKGG